MQSSDSPSLPKLATAIDTRSLAPSNNRRAPSRTHSTPLSSPLQKTPSDNMAATISLHDSGAMTPPLTPVSPSASRASLSLDTPLGRSSIDSLFLADETWPTAELLRFPHTVAEYTIEAGEGKRKPKPLGSGLWSDVYLAHPSSPSATASVPTQAPEMTPPMTPVKKVATSIPAIPRAYAIKIPASRSAKAVLESEARVLSYLSSTPAAAKDYLVPFHGLDSRNGAIVMEALPQTLEAYVTRELNGLSEPVRGEELARIFPSLASDLLRGLEWLSDMSCIHADIKPGNILLKIGNSSVHPVYADFSSATIPSRFLPSEKERPKTPLGGGTWDFLDPKLLVKSADPPVQPEESSDLYALGLTLLFVVVGGSAYDCAGRNVHRRREMVKQGVPLGYAFEGDEGWVRRKRMDSLATELGLGVLGWFERVLGRNGGRPDVRGWRRELERGLRVEGER